MKWYEKFKVGQEVKVVKKIASWTFVNGGGTSWTSPEMDKTIGKTYKIKTVKKTVGYQLLTEKDFPYEHDDMGGEIGFNYWYPVESLACVKGEQLLFNFMN